MTKIETFAEQYRLKATRDDSNDSVIQGRRGQVYFRQKAKPQPRGLTLRRGLIAKAREGLSKRHSPSAESTDAARPEEIAKIPCGGLQWRRRASRDG
jgi:hypothetical protein